MIRAIKYELKPNKAEEQVLNKIFGCSRFIYNWGLNRKIETYAISKTSLSCFDLMKELTVLKTDPNFLWLNDAGSQQLQQSLSNLDNAFTNFFKANKGFPLFKSKRSKQSFRIPQRVKINYNNYTFFIPKIGYVKFFKDKHINGIPKFATVSKTPTGRYFVSITFETFVTNKTGTGEVGVDLGIKTFAVTSNNEVFENQKYLKSSLFQLRVQQRKLDRKFKKDLTEQSKNYVKQKLVVAKLYEKVSNQRLDFLHKITTQLASKYHTVCIEDLDIKGMLKNRILSQSIIDCSWGLFRNILSYKVADLRVIGRFEPSSQICSNCGDRNTSLKLKQRTWVCRNGHVLNRDLNAAINIKNFGLRVSAINAKVGQ